MIVEEIRQSHGELTFVRSEWKEYPSGRRAELAVLRCACGGTVKMKISAWQCRPTERCGKCALRLTRRQGWGRDPPHRRTQL